MPVEAEVEEAEEEEYDKAIIAETPEEILEQYSEEELEELKQNTFQRIQGMSIAEKIQEALKGSKESRGILIKDANKLVSSAVIKSPKITEDEVVKVTTSKNISDEVMRLICNKKEWLRNYQIKVNLINNPKTPFRTSLQFMNFLHNKDLQAVAKSKMVPSIVSTAARKLMTKKQRQ